VTIRIEIFGETAAEVITQLSVLTAAMKAPAGANQFSAPVHPQQIEATPAEKQTRSRKTADKTDAAASAEPAAEAGNESSASADTAAPTTEASAPAAADSLSYAAIRDKLVALSRLKGRDAIVALNDKFGVTNLQNVPEAQWPQLLAAVEAASAA